MSHRGTKQSTRRGGPANSTATRKHVMVAVGQKHFKGKQT